MPKRTIVSNNSLFIRQEPKNGKPYYVHHQPASDTSEFDAFIEGLNEEVFNDTRD